MAKTSTEQYRTNAKSRAKHVKDNSPGGKYAHSKKYKRDHASARASLGIRTGSTQDASKQSDGSYKAESRRTNRGRGGRSRR
tara:strand:- start:213 stop:458 length:246 start_codon:yes stop_codon:yes gene_type:complete